MLKPFYIRKLTSYKDSIDTVKKVSSDMTKVASCRNDCVNCTACAYLYRDSIIIGPERCMLLRLANPTAAIALFNALSLWLPSLGKIFKTASLTCAMSPIKKCIKKEVPIVTSGTTRAGRHEAMA